jgi:hypothetical protein
MSPAAVVARAPILRPKHGLRNANSDDRGCPSSFATLSDDGELRAELMTLRLEWSLVLERVDLVYRRIGARSVVNWLHIPTGYGCLSIVVDRPAR